MPFEKGWKIVGEAEFYGSPDFLTPVGPISVDLYRPAKLSSSEIWGKVAYAVDENGQLHFGRYAKFYNQGYFEFTVRTRWFDDGDEEELEKKGEFDCLVQVTNEIILKGSNRREIIKTDGTRSSNRIWGFINNFSPTEEDKGYFMIHPENPLVKNLMIGFERRGFSSEIKDEI